MIKTDKLHGWYPQHGVSLAASLCTYDVQETYKDLLSLKIPDDEAERRVIQNRINEFDGGFKEASFWLALAQVEWQKGRLSDCVREKAMYFLNTEHPIAPWKDPAYDLMKDMKKRQRVLDSFRKTLSTPMPPRKSVRVRIVGARSPWKAGDLLAWGIMNKEASDCRLFGKYFLVRVIGIWRMPYCYLAPEAGMHEFPLVAMYCWCGDEIPDPAIANHLPYAELPDYPAPKEERTVSCGCLHYTYYEEEAVNKGEITLISHDPSFIEYQFEEWPMMTGLVNWEREAGRVLKPYYRKRE